MKHFKHTQMKHLDIRSILIGFLGSALMITAIGFKNSPDENDGRFLASSGEKGIVIVDSQTGAYIIAPYPGPVGKVHWLKGDFESTFKASIDNKKISTP